MLIFCDIIELQRAVVYVIAVESIKGGHIIYSTKAFAKVI